LTAFTADRLLVECGLKKLNPPKLGFFLSFSTDGGRAWTHVPGTTKYLIGVEPSGVEPVSATVGWGTNDEGEILRTTDGGHSWQTVWPPTAEHHHPAGTLEGLAASGSAGAFASFEIDTAKGTYFLIRATDDAGASWHSVAALTLPSR
jgi:photosystem II stability/assembly factor-like uncharacterized protein